MRLQAHSTSAQAVFRALLGRKPAHGPDKLLLHKLGKHLDRLKVAARNREERARG